MRAIRNRIALFGLFGTGNSGNDGSLESMLDLLRRRLPDKEVLCICGNPANVRRMFGIEAASIGGPDFSTFLLRWIDRLSAHMLRHLAGFRRAVGIMRNYDALIMPGTGILDDFGEGAFSMPFILLGWCLAARVAGARVAFVSVGAGPVHTRLGRLFTKLAAARAHYRSYRDVGSREFMRRLGTDVEKDPVSPDLAFGLPTPPPMRCGEPDRPPVVGLGVMAYYGWADDRKAGGAVHDLYMDAITTFGRHLLEKGIRIRLLTGDVADRPAAERLLDNLAGSGLEARRSSIIFEPTHSLHDLMAQIARTDVVVATRFHNVVCALKLHRPTISIGYAAKNDLLMAAAGLGDFCQHIDVLDLALLDRQFARLMADRETLSIGIRAFAERVAMELAGQEEHLLAGLMEPGECGSRPCDMPAARLVKGRTPGVQG